VSADDDLRQDRDSVGRKAIHLWYSYRSMCDGRESIGLVI
jgi:hypothetical protein